MKCSHITLLLVLASAATGLPVAGCNRVAGGDLIAGAQVGGATKEKVAIPARAPLRLRRLEVHDPGVGCTAFTMLVPVDWKTEGGVQWQMQYANLASARFRAFDPRGGAALEMFPVVPGCWDDGGSLGPSARGQNYMGSVVYPPPTDVLQYVRELFVPGYRANIRGLKIGAATALPEVARAVEQNVQEPGVTKRVSAGKVRLEYEEDGKAIAEDVYITMVIARSPIVPTMTQWSLEHQYSFRAPKADIDRLAPLLQAMSSSIRIELPWYAGYSQVLDMSRKGQMQAIRDAGEISKRTSRNNDAILASMRSSWEARQSSQDRMSREFSESIRGVETYDDPIAGREIQLPGGYDDAWVNARGEYVLSSEAGYDPNVGSTQDWRRLQPAR
ncbi:MAG: hypothetical protein NTY35_07060 [Planctomycetota bacterium]|nr:hypothetical protein [Planctomycetota bacterium]